MSILPLERAQRRSDGSPRSLELIVDPPTNADLRAKVRVVEKVL